MQYRPLGQSGIEASVVALGTWVMGGWMWGGTRDEDSISAIHAALDHGINLIDTAPIYGFGASENLVGQAIKDRREKVVLATKCGMVGNTTRGQFKFTTSARAIDPNGLIDIYQYNHPDSIRGEIERSLNRLQTDYIDLYQTHWQEYDTPIEDTMACLLKLKDEGKIRAIGVCNAPVDDMERYRSVGPLDSDQEKYSMLDRDLEAEQLPYCEKNNIAVLAYSPLALGLLTGKIGPEREFPDGDLRRNNPRFSVENRKRIQQMLGQFEPIAQQHGVSLAQLVIAWTFHQPGLTHALCGARHAKQAEENAVAGTVQLSDDELKQMQQAVDEYAGALTG
jgi:aryl-alcohol dehydrogenase-like predicted oxidoreductase